LAVCGFPEVAALLVEVLRSKGVNTPQSPCATFGCGNVARHGVTLLPFAAQSLNVVMYGGAALLHRLSEYWVKLAEYFHCPSRRHLRQISSVGQDHTHLSTWINGDVKGRLSAVAACQGISESALLRRLVEQMLASSGLEVSVPAVVQVDKRAARLTIRLMPDDCLLLRERAAARSIPAATYVSILVRSHLRALTPLPKEELAELRRSITELRLLGGTLNQIARAMNRNIEVAAPGRQEVQAMIRVAEGLRDHFRALLKANIQSWHQGHA
jgi:hypothetical protein